MNEPRKVPLEDQETDPRYPTGKWVGFFKQPVLPGKHQMELFLAFSHGGITGSGRDWVGDFIIRGRYEIEPGTCYWTKRYLGKHDVFYKGYNEGKGIWGVWDMPKEGPHWKGGFHIWPEGMGDPTNLKLVEAAELPANDPLIAPVREEAEELVPVGGNEPDWQRAFDPRQPKASWWNRQTQGT